jgi:hypothetical protein
LHQLLEVTAQGWRQIFGSVLIASPRPLLCGFRCPFIQRTLVFIREIVRDSCKVGIRRDFFSGRDHQSNGDHHKRQGARYYRNSFHNTPVDTSRCLAVVNLKAWVGKPPNCL